MRGALKSLLKKKSLYDFLFLIFNRVGKRRRFILASFLLTGIILASSFFSLEQAEYFFVILLFFVYVLTFFSILEGIDRAEWLMLFLVPIYFTLSFYLFYFFFPGRWLTRLPYVIVYAISIYAILLSSNIFNVGVTRNLQLFRAAFSVNFLYITLTSYLVYNLILSFKLNGLFNAVLFLVFSYPLIVQFLWTINPKISLDPLVKRYAFIISLVIAEVGLVLSFIPLKSTVFSLFLTAVFYSLAGLFHAFMEEMFFRERIREYIFVFIFVAFITVLSIQWS